MRRVIASVVAAAALLFAGCGPDLSDVPMPKIISGPTYSIDATFDSALNLPTQAPVKLDGKTVGEVVWVKAVDFHAKVRMRITQDTQIPADSRAEVRLSAPIGESFVALLPPKKPASAAQLHEGSTIDISRTRAAPDTTDLLTSMSVAITGGSYADLKTIVTELTTALDGHADEVKHLLGQLDVLVTDLNAHRDDLDTALDGLDRLSGLLAKDSDSLVASTQQITPAIQELNKHEDAALKLLSSMTRLSAASTDVINATSAELGRQLRDATTLLDTVVAAQDKLGPTLTSLNAFATKLDGATPGDYTMFDLVVKAIPQITGLPFVNLDGSPLIQPPTFATPKAPTVATPKAPVTSLLPDLLRGLAGLGGSS